MKEKELVKTSKQISYILRHRPESANITWDKNGYVEVDVLIKHLKISFQDLEEIVATNNKKRFAFNDDKKLIRASQGHSKPVDLQLKAVEPPRILFHGTGKRIYESKIHRQGLSKMNRQHVHMSTNQKTAKEVGSRHGTPMVLIVLSGDMHADGHKFFQSENNVWLTDKVLKKYLRPSSYD